MGTPRRMNGTWSSSMPPGANSERNIWLRVLNKLALRKRCSILAPCLNQRSPDEMELKKVGLGAPSKSSKTSKSYIIRDYTYILKKLCIMHYTILCRKLVPSRLSAGYLRLFHFLARFLEPYKESWPKEFCYFWSFSLSNNSGLTLSVQVRNASSPSKKINWSVSCDPWFKV